MRETIGSTWTFQLIFGFILLFVSFLAVTISYSKAFRIKNEITSIIEKYGGYTTQSAELINNYVKSLGYRNMGVCSKKDDSDALGITNIDAETKEGVQKNKRYYYCIKKEQIWNGQISNVYYEVTFFYKFDLPNIGDITTFKIKGKTTDMTGSKRDLIDTTLHSHWW